MWATVAQGGAGSGRVWWALGAARAGTAPPNPARPVPAPASRRVKRGDPDLPPTPGRYHLVVSLACPWACRCLTVRGLKGLEAAVGVSIVHPTWQRTRPDDPADTHAGWVFCPPSVPPLANTAGHGAFDGRRCTPDPIFGAASVRDLYAAAGAAGAAKFSVPVLIDRMTKTIVSNESSDIVRMLNAEFNDCAARPDLDLYPAHLRPTIDAINDWIQPHINDGVYRCGFSKAQGAYDTAFEALFAALDRVDAILQASRFLCGPSLTEADVRLFQTLVRFDEARDGGVEVVCIAAGRQRPTTLKPDPLPRYMQSILKPIGTSSGSVPPC